MATPASSPSSSALNTSKVQGRRKLNFSRPEDAIADARALAAAEAAGKLERLGNWTPGQCFGHVAAFINYAFDGYPPEMPTPPWFVVIMVRLFKKRLLKGFPAGMRLKGVEGGTLGIEPISTAEGLTKLEAAFARLSRSAPTKPNPVFGAMTHDEWLAMHLRHAELHQSFLRVRT